MPIVAQEHCFALKGGIAINLFVRDLPRLSVDIDLAYLPVLSREESLQEIDTALKNIAVKIENLEKLLAVRWKLQNIQKLPDTKHAQLLEQLAKALE